METARTVFKEAYDKLLTQLEKNASEYAQLRERQVELIADTDKIQKAIDALEPLLRNEVKITDAKMIMVQPSKVGPIRWKHDTIEFLKKGLKSSYTSPEIFENIYPNSDTLSKTDRRKKMANLSVALIELVASGDVVSANNSEGRGNIYWLSNKIKIPA